MSHASYLSVCIWVYVRIVSLTCVPLSEQYCRNKCKVTLVVTGCHTNIALLLSVCPGVKDMIECISFMGGAVTVGERNIDFRCCSELL